MTKEVVKALSQQLLDLREAIKEVTPGTEAYSKINEEIKTTAEALSKVPQADKTKIVIEIAKTIGVVAALALVLAFSIDRIVDSKAVSLIRSVVGLV